MLKQIKQGVALAALSLMATIQANAQIPTEGVRYCLPKTQLQFHIMLEKTSYTPGKLAGYAQHYLKESHIGLNPTTTWRILKTEMNTAGVPDTSKCFTLITDKKHSITRVSRSDNGVLLAVNADVTYKPTDSQLAVFKPAKTADTHFDTQYMSEDILRAGSYAKMAELTAQEIYDIRDSRNALSRGEADFMPKDGTQLKLMLQNLDRQEKGLLQAFEGTTTKDTTVVSLDFTPTKATSNQLFFRLSKWSGITDIDDLSGSPYYITIERQHDALTKAPSTPEDEKKKEKTDIGLRVNQPEKIKISLSDGHKLLGQWETEAGQFGSVEALSGELFGKKQSSSIILDPISGGLKKLEAITVTE